jgi:heme/copper-type cytochrome/quinol oxidase subunit 2
VRAAASAAGEPRAGRAGARAKELQMSSTLRVVLGIGVVIVAVVLLVVLKDNGDDGATTQTETAQTAGGGGSGGASKPAVTTIVVERSGRPVGGIAEISVEEGEEVRFKVKSAVADEVHMHGYDIMKDVEAGGSVTFDFPATLEGIFEAELEGRSEQILELRVNP